MAEVAEQPGKCVKLGKHECNLCTAGGRVFKHVLPCHDVFLEAVKQGWRSVDVCLGGADDSNSSKGGCQGAESLRRSKRNPGVELSAV